MKRYTCLFPCRKAFGTLKGLRMHRSQVKTCFNRFKRYCDRKSRVSTSSTTVSSLSQEELRNIDDEEDNYEEYNHEEDIEDIQMDSLHSHNPVIPLPSTSSNDLDTRPGHQPLTKKKRVTFLLPEDHRSPSPQLPEEWKQSSMETETSPQTTNYLGHKFSIPASDNESDGSSYLTDSSDSRETSSVSDSSTDDQTSSSESSNDMHGIGRNTFEDTSSSSIDDVFEDAGSVIGLHTPPFVRLLSRQQRVSEGNIYYPFAGPLDWELAAWLHDSHLSQQQIDKFVRLRYVSTVLNRCYNH